MVHAETVGGAVRTLAAQRSHSAGAVRILAAVLLTALAAHVRVPVPGTTVPMTLQLLAVLVVSLALPLREALGGLTLYLACGAVGLPVFAPGSPGLWGDTGGYLAGFIAGAATIGVLRGQRPSGVRMALAAFGGAAVVLAAGVTWRAAWWGDWSFAVATGAWPFAPKALVESLLAAALVRKTGRWAAS